MRLDRALHAAAALAFFATVSCDKTEEQAGGQLKCPEFIQVEEVIDSPLTLAFSWLPVENADSYSYVLYEIREDMSASDANAGIPERLTSGVTSVSGVIFTSDDRIQLYSGTRYRIDVNAHSSKGIYSESDTAMAEISTGAGPFKMSITNLTYRSADFEVVPSDNTMLYQCATISLDKYEKYDSDRQFIEEYDFGYYKHIKEVWSIPMPWYEYMKSCSEKKTKKYSSRNLSPESQYIFYAYRTDFTGNDSKPVETSGFTKKIFTTPKWAPVSDCSFDVSIERQTLAEGGNEVNVEILVRPSDENEHYMVLFLSKDEVDLETPFNTASTIVHNLELLCGITDWDTSELSFKGTSSIGSTSIAVSDQLHVSPDSDSAVLVFGLDNIGCITTDISVTEFHSIGK